MLQYSNVQNFCTMNGLIGAIGPSVECLENFHVDVSFLSPFFLQDILEGSRPASGLAVGEVPHIRCPPLRGT